MSFIYDYKPADSLPHFDEVSATKTIYKIPKKNKTLDIAFLLCACDFTKSATKSALTETAKSAPLRSAFRAGA